MKQRHKGNHEGMTENVTNWKLLCTAHAPKQPHQECTMKFISDFIKFSHTCLATLIYSTRKLSFWIHVSAYEEKIELTLAHKSKLPCKPNKEMIKKVLFAYPTFGRDKYNWTETEVLIKRHKASASGKK